MGDEETASSSLSAPSSSSSCSSLVVGPSYSEIDKILELPELVVEKILEELRYDAESLVNCSRISLTWDRILSKNKTDFLFHFVLPIIANSFSFQELLQLGLVSRNWKRAVESLIHPVQDPSSCNLRIEQVNFPEVSIETINVRKQRFRGWTKISNLPWEDERNVIKFMNFMRTQSANPFRTRIVLYESFMPTSLNTDAVEPVVNNVDEIIARPMSNFERLLEYDRYFHSLLGIFGRNIWHLVYSVQEENPQDDHRANNELSPRYVFRMLRLVENLRSFTIIYRFGGAQIADWSAAAGSPVLPKLKALSMRLERYTLDVQQALLGSYSNQLEILECSYSLLLLPHINPNPNPPTFPKLKTLKMLTDFEMAPWKTGEGSDYYLEQLSSTFVMSRLQRFSLELIYLGSVGKTLWNMMVGIKNWSTLVELYVDFIEDEHHTLATPQEVTCPNMELQLVAPLPNISQLKRLSIPMSVASSPDMLWLLSKCPLLTELQFLEKGGTRENSGVIEVGHLWDAAPTLGKISVGEFVQWRPN